MGSDRGRFGDVRTGEIGLDRTDSGVTVLTISGEHDLNTAPQLRGQLDHLLGGGDPIVIDLTPASFIDSSIIGVVLEGRRRADDAGTGFAVAHGEGADAVGRVLEVTRLREELPVHGSLDAALKHASSNTGKPSS